MTTRSQRTWLEPPDHTPDTAFQQAIGGHPLVARILAQRGYDTIERAQPFLSASHYPPTPGDALPDLAAAAAHLNRALHDGDRILVWGDFDVDGQTATALFVDALRHLGGDVTYHIPHRLRDSHGIRLDRLRDALDRTAPHVLLTCDTGISDVEALDYTKSLGLITLITDHHALPTALPPADAIITPRRLPPDHPLASLPGVGVAYKLIEHLYALHGRPDEAAQFLDLVALGIVADLAEQTRDTRYLLQRGLDQLRATARPGLNALIEAAALPVDHLSASDIAFQLGPRLNAAGRLADATLAVELLTTQDTTRAHTLALQLEGLNNQRRLLSRQVYAAALAQIAQEPALLDREALVLFDPTWHAGIIGLVAGRLAELYGLPTALLTAAPDAGVARGSARSVPGCDLSAALTAHTDLLLSHGGHAGAAGFSLRVENIDALRRALSQTFAAACDGSTSPGLGIDATVSLADVTPELATELHRLAPFGEGNPPVTLAVRDLTLRSAAIIGRGREHRRLTVQDASGKRAPVMWWNAADQALPRDPFDLACRLEFSAYQGSTDLQLVLVDVRRAASAPPEIARPPRQVLDYRGAPPEKALADLLAAYPHAAVWAEGYRRADSPGVTLDELTACDTLVIYTTPPVPQALQRALAKVSPSRIALVAVDPPLMEPADVLRRLLELLKYVMNQHEGRTTLRALAGAVGHADSTVDAALGYLAASGEIAVVMGGADALVVTPRHGAPAHDAADKLTAFQAHLAETAAYRTYFGRALPEHLLGDDAP